MTESNKQALLLEQYQIKPNQALEPFIYTDILAEYAGNHQVNCFHFWTMKNQLILGMQDTRVNDLEKGLTSIMSNQYHPIVRNSGGLAVVADEGVLNFSLIMPQPSEKFAISIDNGYEFMKEVIEKALGDFKASIDAFEVSDSYCPGEFDLSIDGKKFAGISQRRIKKGIGIMIYLSVNGNQQARGELVRDFYQASLGEDFGQKNFPPVNPDSMANLSDLLKADLTVADMVTRLKKVIATDYIISDEKQQTFNDFLESEDFKDSYIFQEKRMLQRNEIINWEALDKWALKQNFQ